MNFTRQQEAVIQSTSDAIVCVAVPGSGKTTALIARIHELIRQYHQPERIVAITYTVAAAEEIQKRLGDLKIGYVGTLHSWCFSRLQRLASEIGFTAPLSVVTGDDASELLDEHTANLNWKGTRKALDAAVAEAVYTRVQELQILTPVQRLAHSFFVKMLSTGLLTFDGVLYWTLRSFTAPFDPDVGIHLLVDEYQDASRADEKIYGFMPCETRFVVGDDAQAIYGFRGGNHAFLTGKLKNPRWASFGIEQSQRCSIAVCEAATNLMLVSPFPKYVQSATGVKGSASQRGFDTTEAEMDWLAEQLLHKQSNGFQTAVLCRTNYLVQTFASGLASRGVKIAGNGRKKYAFDPVDWSKAKLFLSGLANPENNWIVANCVARVSGKTAAELFIRAAMLSEKSVNQLMRVFPDQSTVDEGIKWLASMPGRVGESTLNAVRLIAERAKPGSFFELLGIMQQLEDEVEEGSEGVTVKTMHGAKGLEWDFVYLPAFEQEIVPGPKTRDVEEERRLVFVALTRARIGVAISFSGSRQLNEFQPTPTAVKPSQFINEAATN